MIQAINVKVILWFTLSAPHRLSFNFVVTIIGRLVIDRRQLDDAGSIYMCVCAISFLLGGIWSHLKSYTTLLDLYHLNCLAPCSWSLPQPVLAPTWMVVPVIELVSSLYPYIYNLRKIDETVSPLIISNGLERWAWAWLCAKALSAVTCSPAIYFKPQRTQWL